MVIAFWNINKKNLSDLLVELVKQEQVDILILAETDDKTIVEFLTKNNKVNTNRQYNQVSSPNDKITVLTSYSLSVFTNKSSLYPSPRWNAFNVKIPSIIEFNLFPVHFHSKVNWSESSLALECVNFSRDVQTVEKNTGCFDSILIGDFNMNPFEDGIVAANGIHAIQDLNYAHKKKNGRNIDGLKYDYFYNPMWNFFGDKSSPYGTHYHRTAGHISQEWNIYDQVIIRPSLKKYLKGDYVKIITRVGTEQLTGTFQRPDKKNYSDHLPITLQIKT